MKCVGTNFADAFCICACFMRQIKGCNNDKMNSGKNVRKNFAGIIQKIDWEFHMNQQNRKKLLNIMLT